MIKKILFSMAFLVSGWAFAEDMSLIAEISQKSINLVQQKTITQGLNWKQGDENNYSVDMGFIKGSMVMLVKSITAEGIWMDQNIDLGFAGKQQVQILLDQNTGEVKKMIVNGKEQAAPKNNVEVVEVKDDKITVPAGTFECLHATLQDKDNKEQMNIWVNPQAIPLSGMLKTIQPSQFGEVTILLTSFKKN
ncbi:MAG: hypothetical protein ACOYOK_06375 [Pseudobdellovibrionaceae bacterium]